MFYQNKRWKSVVIITLCLFFFAYLSLWAVTIPFDGAPDEELRYMIPKYIYQHWSLPTGYQSEVIYREGYYSYAFYPQYLGAILSAMLMKLPEIAGIKGLSLLYLARLASIFSGLGLSYMLGKTSERLTGRFGIRLLAMSLVIFWPQLTFLSAYVNNDIIGLLGVAIIVDVMVATALKKDWLLRDTFELSLGYMFCLLGYINTYPFVLFSGCYFLFMLFKVRKVKEQSWAWLINHGLILSLIMVVVVLPFFLRNYLLYHDVFGNTVFEARNQQWVKEGHQATMFPYRSGSFWHLVTLPDFWRLTFKSSIGYFGYMTTGMSSLKYGFYVIVLGFGAVTTLVLSFIRLVKRTVSLEWFTLVLSLLMSIVVMISLFLYRAYYVDFQAQGRYIIAFIIPLFLMMISGYFKWLGKLPRKWFISIVVLMILVLLLQNLDIYHDYIYHVYVELGKTR